jgi:hypothetical protein
MNEKFLLFITKRSQKIGVVVFLILFLMEIIRDHTAIKCHRHSVPTHSKFLELEKKSSEKYFRFLFPEDNYPWFVSCSGTAMFSSVGLQQIQTSEQLSVQWYTNVAPFINFISLSFKHATVFLFNANFLLNKFFILPPVDSHYTIFRSNYNIYNKNHLNTNGILKGFIKPDKIIFGGYNGR